MEKFYLSSAIPYVNYRPHCGFALEIIQADVVARYHRVLGNDVFFLTGTDENSLKNVRAAEKEGISTKKLVNRNAQKFYDLKKALNLTFDDFIRTTEERHIKGAQKLWLACQEDIYKKKYKGLYCVGCEAFYKESELINGLCPEHKTKPELVEEENYFFKLSKYQNKIKEIIKDEEVKIIPKTRKNEVLSFIDQGLEDICISRPSKRVHGWGIPVPGDPSQFQWCWYDALSNYITALGYAENSKRFQEWWQENDNILHIIGKGVIRFHAIYWLGFLLSARLNLPRTIFVHGYLTSDGQKMSKSLGNVVDPFELVEKYGTDAVRYFLLREITPTEDGDFTYDKFEARYNSDLASGLGNLVARVTTLGQGKNFESGVRNGEFEIEIDKVWQNYRNSLDDFKFNEALISIWRLISFCDKYIEKEKAWEESDNQLSVINNLLFALTNIAQMLEPFLPETSKKIFKQLGINSSDKEWHFKVRKEKSLFPRLTS
jgi:methionyl-tRNA synthetase